jgi:hypothetical protein
VPNIIRLMKSRSMIWAWPVERMRVKRNACSVSVGNAEGETPIGRTRRRWEMDLREIGWSSTY